MDGDKPKQSTLVRLLTQLFRLKVLWGAMALHVTALVFIFHYGLVILAYFILLCFSLYCFLAAILIVVKGKNISLGGAYLLASILIIATTLPPIASKLEGFRYWLRFVPDQQKYESDVAKLLIGKDGYRRGSWDWGPDPDGGGIELVYDESDQEIAPHDEGGCVKELPRHITGHFYFVRTVCPGII